MMPQQLSTARDSLLAQTWMAKAFWSTPRYGLGNLLLVVVLMSVGMVAVVIALAQPAAPTAPIGQPAADLDLGREPDGGYAAATRIVNAWALASSQGAFFDAEQYMQGVDDLTRITWRDSVSQAIRNDFIRPGNNTILQLDSLGTGKVALVQWTGVKRPMCAAVEVSRTGQLRPLSFPHFCTKAEQ